MENISSPSVLVTMPVYNAMPYLKQAISSILQQTYSSFTLMVVDDGSTDGSYEYVAGLGDPRILLVRQSHGGPSKAFNKTLVYAIQNKFSFIVRTDADDISMPERIEKQIRALQEHPEFAAISCNCLYIDERENVIGNSTVPISPKLVKWEIGHGLRGLIQGASAFRTSLLAQIGGYNEGFPQAEDTDLFMRLSERFVLSNLPDYLYRIRVHKNSLSNKNLQKNILYHLYAIRCHKDRLRGLQVQTFQRFSNNLGVYETISYYQELILLKMWKSGMESSNLFHKILAALASPKRVLARVMRQSELAWSKGLQ